jgi:hypothetical protein
MNATPVEQRNFYLAASAWQDSLLQSYRTFHVTIQGFLITAGMTVLSVQLTGAVQGAAPEVLSNLKLALDVIFNAFYGMLLSLLYWLQRRLTDELSGVAANRALDVNHWHLLTIMIENDLDVEQRSFTYFKMWQQAKRQDVQHLLSKYTLGGGITLQQAEELIGKGLGHTRYVLDVNLFKRLNTLWLAVLATTYFIGVWFLIRFFYYFV